MDKSSLIDQLEELVYISNIDTYNLIYVNEPTMRSFNLSKDYQSLKCYEALYRRTSPCDFCTNSFLTKDDFYVWERENPIVERRYILKDKLINWHGTNARLEIAFDITDKETISKGLMDKLELEDFLISVIETLASQNNFKIALKTVLEGLLYYYKADRAFIFQFMKEEGVVRNTFEICNDNIEPLLQFLQNIPYDDLTNWQQSLETCSEMIIVDPESIQASMPKEYTLMNLLEAKSLMLVAIKMIDGIDGFLGITNPRDKIGDFTLLRTLSYFIVTENEKRNAEQEMLFITSHDPITGCYNGEKYAEDMFAAININHQDFAIVEATILNCDHSKSYIGEQPALKMSAALKGLFAGHTIYHPHDDKFLVMCYAIEEDDFTCRLSHLRDEIRKHKDFNASIGGAWTHDRMTIEQLRTLAVSDALKDSRSAISFQVNSAQDGYISLHGAEYDYCAEISKSYYSIIFEVDYEQNCIVVLEFSDKELLPFPQDVSCNQCFQYAKREIIHPDDLDKSNTVFLKLTAASAFDTKSLETEYRHKTINGDYCWISAYITINNGKIIVFLKNMDKKVHRILSIQEKNNPGLKAASKVFKYMLQISASSDAYLRIINEIIDDAHLPTLGEYSTQMTMLANDLIHPDDRKKWLDFMNIEFLTLHLSDPGDTVNIEYRMQAKNNGEYLWYNNIAFFADAESDDYDCVYVICFDIHRNKISTHNYIQKELREQILIQKKEMDLDKARYRFIVEKMVNGIFEWSSDPEALPIRWNTLTGGSYFVSRNIVNEFDYNELDGDLLLFFLKNKKVHPHDEMAYHAFLYKNNNSRHKEIVCRLTNNGADFKWFKLAVNSIYSLSGSLERYLGTIVDVDNETRAMKTLQYRAERDVLTGLLNQEVFYRRGQKILEKKNNYNYVMITMDIDKFKVINDMFGLEEGNRTLIRIARILESCVGEGDICGRMYADVFCIMTKCRTDSETFALVNRITQKMALCENGSMLVPSFGVCRIENRNIPVTKICELSGFAHKSAKRQGPEKLRFYNDTIRQHSVEEKQIESEMGLALRKGQFMVYLQPKYDIMEEKIVGSEALVRWNHPTHGLIAPNKFIPLFERNGFILKLDVFVWEECCKILQRWIAQGHKPVPISVNVSRLHLHNPAFKQTLFDLMQKYNLDHRLIELELTESLFVENVSYLSSILESLRLAGFTLDMDDFGTGYSSLNMLRNIHIDVLKIDCGFFNETVATERGKVVIKHTIAMSRDLNMSIVAEGVETAAQVEFLKEIGCHIIQGFYFSKPVPVPDFEKLVFENQPPRELLPLS